MSERVVTDLEDDGRVLTRKRSRSDAEQRSLIHEAEVLSLARHPGVVELVDCAQDGEATVLTTVFVGTHSAETVGPVDVERAAAIVADLADTVADLHQVGLVHGRIDPTHVLIGAGGRPVLCGFAGGGRIGTTPLPGQAAAPGFVDPAASGEAALTPQRDVYALGALLRTLIGATGAELEPIPERRIAKVKAPWTGYQRRALLTLADRATDDAPLRRPPARRLAADIRDTIPGARLDRESVDPYAALRAVPDDPRPRQRNRRAGFVAIGVGLVLLVAGLAGLPGADADVGVGAPAALEPAPSATTERAIAPTPVPPSTSTTSTTDPRCASADAPLADDLDGDGCGDPIHVEGDRILVVGARRFSVGSEGDLVALGDWDCDGVASPALLRPSTGSVFVFDRWTDDGRDVSVAPRATVPGAVAVTTRLDAQGCSTLVVVRADGTEADVT